MATLLKLKIYLMIFWVVSACSSKPAINVYASDPLQGGLVRAQGGEIIPYQESQNYMCVSKQDLKTILTAVKYKNEKNRTRTNPGY